jgi:hypothetical protein
VQEVPRDHPAPLTGLQLSLPQFLEAIRTGKDFHPDATRMLVVMPWTTLRGRATSTCNDCHTHPDRTADEVNTSAFLTGGTVFAVPPPLRPVFKQVRAMSANLRGQVHAS